MRLTKIVTEGNDNDVHVVEKYSISVGFDVYYAAFS